MATWVWQRGHGGLEESNDGARKGEGGDGTEKEEQEGTLTEHLVLAACTSTGTSLYI